jgi:hypothetical protein
VVDIPWPGQGETNANPKPEPSASKMNERPSEAKAPATIEDHDTAERGAGSGARLSPGIAPASLLNVCAMTPAQ